jgi:hypothetical protein
VDGRSAADPPVMLVIADYAVELQFYDFGMDDLDETGENPGLRWYQNVDQVADPEGGGMLGPTNNEANPQDLRLVTAKLTVRTEGEDPSYTMIPRTTPFAPLDGYETTQMEGACRTLSLATRVELSSLAVRNLKENLP